MQQLLTFPASDPTAWLMSVPSLLSLTFVRVFRCLFFSYFSVTANIVPKWRPFLVFLCYPWLSNFQLRRRIAKKSALPCIPFSLPLFQSILCSACVQSWIEKIHFPRLFHRLCQPVFAPLCLFLASTTSIITCFVLFPGHSCLHPLPVICHWVLRENFPPSFKPTCMLSTGPARPGNVSSVGAAGSSLVSAPQSTYTCAVGTGLTAATWFLWTMAMTLTARCFKHVNS